MSNRSCPVPFLDASLFPVDQGYIDGRLCSTITLPGAKPGSSCCLPCPVQDYTLYPSSIRALHANDIINIVGVGVGAFVLLVLFPSPYKFFSHNSLLFFYRKKLLIEIHWE